VSLGLACSTNGLVEQVEKHRSTIVASVVAPCVLVQVALQPPGRDGVVDAMRPVLDESEEPLDRLSVNVPVHVDGVAQTAANSIRRR
jgi:hypothetical protein